MAVDGWYWFGGGPGLRTSDCYLVDEDAQRVAGAPCTVADAETGTPLTELLDANGTPATSVVSGAQGYLTFAAKVAIVDVTSGSEVFRFASSSAIGDILELAPTVDALAASAATSATSATAAQTAAEIVAAAAGAPAATAIDTHLGGDATDLVPTVEGKLDKSEAISTYGAVKGSCLGRFIGRANAGETLKATCLGDSILEGQTVTTPATDGMMILLAADLSTRFTTTVTQTNWATSGYTALRAFTDGKLAGALADKADLYIISAFDKNDLGAEISGTGGLYAPGYPQAQSLGAIERMVRAVRTSVPKADIILLATNPYTSGSSSNAYQQAKDRAVRRIAATYGCEFVDGYAAFVALGVYSTHMLDTTHPNTLGHRLLADTVLSHIPTTPALTVAPGAVGTTGLFNPQDVEGIYAALTTAAALSCGLIWTNTGTFAGTGGSSAYTSSTPGDYAEFTFTGTELAVLMSTALVNAVVLDVTVDTIIVAANQGFTNGKQGDYYVPIAVGLTPGPHTIRLTLKSGTLKMQRASIAKYAPPVFTPETRVVQLNPAAATLSLTAGYQLVMAATPVLLPAGWGSMDMVFTGWWSSRISGSTTVIRRVDLCLRETGVNIDGIRQVNVPITGATGPLPPMALPGVLLGLARNASVDVQVKLDVADAAVQSLAVLLSVLLIRKS